jgi:hypothetical protein
LYVDLRLHSKFARTSFHPNFSVDHKCGFQIWPCSFLILIYMWTLDCIPNLPLQLFILIFLWTIDVRSKSGPAVFFYPYLYMDLRLHSKFAPTDFHPNFSVDHRCAFQIWACSFFILIYIWTLDCIPNLLLQFFILIFLWAIDVHSKSGPAVF